MGCGTSVMESEENDPFLEDKRINDAINQSLQLNKQNDKNQVKLLLLGAGESGKSTVLKQLTLMHKGGFTQQERMQFAQVMWVDSVQSMKILVIQARKLGIALDCDQVSSSLVACRQIVLRADALEQIDTGAAGGTNFLNEYVLRYSEEQKTRRKMNSTGVANTAIADDVAGEAGSVSRGGVSSGAKIDTDQYVSVEEISSGLSEVSRSSARPERYTRVQIAEAISALWKSDRGIRRCFERSYEFQMESNASYYFDNIHKFADPNYLCTDTDILKGRIKTTGITETNFNINSFKFKVLDAGGQRSERKKWIHCFENITAILFVLAISEYNQTLFEDERVNRMHESIILFDSICNSKWFWNTPFILFLNKIDILEHKLKKYPLKRYFPEYSGRPDDLDEVISFFETNFLKLNRTKKPIYVHRTCATDTKSMKFVLTAVTDMIVQQNLKKSGII